MASSQKPSLARAWRQRDLPAVDDRLCTACQRCVAICPTVCLAMDRHVPWLPRPEDCISCGACVFVCPTAALALVKLDANE